MLRMLWVVTYDIGDDRLRRQIEKQLGNVGERVQYSVFEAWLSERERTRLINQVNAQAPLEAESDSIRWYGLCAHCQRQVRFLGKGLRPDDPTYYIV
jgi:CRISPR-associated protein Cas2